MSEVEAHLKLTYMGAAKVLAATTAQAEEIGAAECIAFTDGGTGARAAPRIGDPGQADQGPWRDLYPVVQGHLVGRSASGRGLRSRTARSRGPGSPACPKRRLGW